MSVFQHGSYKCSDLTVQEKLTFQLSSKLKMILDLGCVHFHFCEHTVLQRIWW